MLRDNKADLEERVNFVQTIFMACKTVYRTANFSLPIGLMGAGIAQSV
jgi:hypothetical protein